MLLHVSLGPSTAPQSPPFGVITAPSMSNSWMEVILASLVPTFVTPHESAASPCKTGVVIVAA